MDLAARLFPQPCTPVIKIPLGGTRPNFWPSGVRALFRLASHSRKRCRQLNRASGDDDGAAGGAKLFSKFAKTAANFVIFTVTRKILQQKDAVALYHGNV